MDSIGGLPPLVSRFPHGGGASVVDYILGSPALAPQITDFRTAPLSPGADHTYLFFHILAPRVPPTHTPHYTIYHDIHFDHTLSPDYSAHLASLLRHIDTIPSLDHRAALITHSLHNAARHIFPSTTRSTRPPPAGSTPCNSWYDDKCKALRSTL